MKRSYLLCILILVCSVKLTGQVPDWLWANAIHTNSYELGKDIAVDPATGDVYVAGTWEDDLSSFFPGSLRSSTNFSSTYGNWDGLLIKYDANGNLIWAFKIGGSGNDEINAVHLDPTGNIYITGYIDVATNYFSGTYSATLDSTVINTNMLDMFVAKYNPDGGLLWVKSSNNDVSNVEGKEICSNSSSLFVIGYAEGSTDFGSSTGSFDHGGKDFYILSLDFNGAAQWTIAGGSNKDDIGRGIIADENYIYCIGDFSGTSLSLFDASSIGVASLLNVDDGTEDIFIVAYDISGNYVWSQSIGASNRDNGKGIANDSDSLYLTGNIRDGALFPGYSGNPVAVSGGDGIFICSLGKLSGSAGWVKSISTSGGGDDSGTDIIVSSPGTLSVAGFFNDDMLLFGDTVISSTNHEDLFIASFSVGGVFNWAKKAGGLGHDDMDFKIASNKATAIYLTGNYEDETVFDATTLPDNGFENMFFAKVELACIDAIGGIVKTADSTICEGEVANLLLEGYYGTIEWQSSPAGFNSWSTIPSEVLPDLSITPVTDTDYRAYLTSGTCQPDSSSVMAIRVNPLPTAVISGDATVCQDGSLVTLTIDLTGSPPWDIIIQRDGANEATINGILSSPFTIDVADEGVYTLAQVLDTNCMGTTSGSATIVFLPKSTAALSGDITICEGTLADLTVDLLGAGPWDLTYSENGIPFVINGIGTTPYLISVSPSSTSTYDLLSLVDANGCIGTVSGNVTVIVDIIPAVDPGTGGEMCDLDFALNANLVAGNGTWSKLTGPGNAIFSDATDPNALVTVDLYGTYEFKWTVVNGTCTDDSTFTVYFWEQPVVNAGSGGDECDLDFALQAIPSVGIGMWTLTSGPGIATFTPDSGSPNALVVVDTYGSYDFTWTEVNGICSSSSTITVNFFELPIPNAGSGGDECDLDFTFQAIPSIGTGGWWMLSGPGNPTYFPGEFNPSATVVVDQYGDYVFAWVEANGPCADFSLINVNFYEQPVANAGSGGVICGPDFSLQALPSLGTGTWLKRSGPGTPTFSPDSNDPNAMVRVDIYGVYEFTWEEVNGTCIDEATITVTFIQQPIANPGPERDVCGLGFAFQAVPTVGSGTWSSLSGPGVISFSSNETNPDATIVVSTYGTYRFAWTEVNGICSDDSIVTINFYPQPVANAGPDQVLEFIQEITMQAELTGSFTGKWSVISGTGLFDDVTSPISRVSGLSEGENIFAWEVTNGPCSDIDEVKIIITNMVIPSVITPNGDMKNDYFIIRGINTTRPVELTIFNRWSAEVYKDKLYRNNWDGRDHNGNDLPADTYFYVIKLPGGRIFKGYIVIKR